MDEAKNRRGSLRPRASAADKFQDTSPEATQPTRQSLLNHNHDPANVNHNTSNLGGLNEENLVNNDTRTPERTNLSQFFNHASIESLILDES